MAAGPSIDVTAGWRSSSPRPAPDLLRSMVHTFAEAPMGAEVDAVCGAGYGERRLDAVTHATGTGGGSGIPGRARSSW
jgi:hypothetical protein